MRLNLFDFLDATGWIGDIKIDKSQGFPDVIFVEFTGQDQKDWRNT